MVVRKRTVNVKICRCDGYLGSAFDSQVEVTEDVNEFLKLAFEHLRYSHTFINSCTPLETFLQTFAKPYFPGNS